MTILKLDCGKEIPLRYSTLEMLDIQEDVGQIDAAIKTLNGLNPDDDKDLSKIVGKDQLKALGSFLRIMGNAGLRERGEEANMKNREILSWIQPWEIYIAVNAVMDEIAVGMRSEIPDKEEEGPVDVTLEEIKKKEMKDD